MWMIVQLMCDLMFVQYIGGSRGGMPSACPPMGPNSFVFTYIFGESTHVGGPHPPVMGPHSPMGNPGSATAIHVH